ncbi:MAG TPA: ATP-binding protein [Xanthomonadaceae bacterium]|nr:ATP-binding protein [Xanthomonadaceae bacterium]
MARDHTLDEPPPVPADVDALRARLAAREAELADLHREFEQFAYGVSHDLRAPLRTIDSFGMLLRRELGDDISPAARDHLARVLGASDRLGGLLEALLDLSRAGRNKLQVQPVDLSLLADWALAELQEAEPDRAVDIDIQPGLAVNGDEPLLRHVLQRLLHNAWKFAEPGQPVRISLSGEHVGDRWHLRLHDEGRGFDMRYSEKLFAPFQRLHGPDEGAGHGMGLAIARRIIERHGGTIRAESAPGQGTTFHIELPDQP